MQDMVDNWNGKNPPSKRGGTPWDKIKEEEDDGISGVAIFFLLLAIFGPLGIMLKRHYFPKDEREKEQPEQTMTFPDPMALPDPQAFS